MRQPHDRRNESTLLAGGCFWGDEVRLTDERSMLTVDPAETRVLTSEKA